jgi:hypothetical protein
MTQQQLAEIREEIANGQLLSYDDSRLLLAEVERQGIEIDHTHAIEPVLRGEVAAKERECEIILKNLLAVQAMKDKHGAELAALKAAWRKFAELIDVFSCKNGVSCYGLDGEEMSQEHIDVLFAAMDE